MNSQEDIDYKQAYLRERIARIEAERLLDDKTRALYDNVVALELSVVDLNQTQGQLIQSEKMASIGQLAAGVAHEINNPIGFVLSNTQVMQGYVDNLLSLERFTVEKLTAQQELDWFEEYMQRREALEVDYIHKDINELITDSLGGLIRVKCIVENLKTVSHNSSDFVPCQLNDCIEQALKVVMSEFKYKVVVQKQLATLPLIGAHPGQLQQVLINMFVNAAHACEQDGVLTVTTSCDAESAPGWVAIQIQDNGCGMSSEIRSKIFDPFYTTKSVGTGTGLGLSVAFGIIQKHHGKIAVESEEGQGTVFTIELPID
jgi:two-component system NtrC family sensor kinase